MHDFSTKQPHYAIKEHGTEELSLRELSFKLLMLIALVSGQRGQALQLLDIENMRMDEDCVFFLPNCLKQSRPGVQTRQASNCHVENLYPQ